MDRKEILIIFILAIIIIILIIIASTGYALYNSYIKSLAIEQKTLVLVDKADQHYTLLEATKDAIIALGVRSSQYETKIPTVLQLCQLAMAQGNICAGAGGLVPPPTPPCTGVLMIFLIFFTLSDTCKNAGFVP